MGSSSPTASLYHGLLLTCILGASSAQAAPSIVPDDIAYKPTVTRADSGDVVVGTAELPPATPGLIAPDIAVAPATTYLSKNHCPDTNARQDNLQKSFVITRFIRRSPQTANAGNLYAAESGVPELIRAQLDQQYQSISPAVLEQGLASTNLTDAQRKQQAQKIARQARTQFVVSGTIHDMAMDTPEATYAPNLYRRTANTFHDVSGLQKFDKRTRALQLEVELRDGFTGDVLFTKRYASSGIWNQRKPVGFDSSAFFKTPYGKRVVALTNTISAELAQVIHCQPFMATIDSHPGQAQILLHGGANNGLHAGDNLHLYQVVVVGSNTDYQVADTRLVKRDTRLYLSEVYPSHSIAVVEGGSYLNGSYLAVSE